MPNIDEIVQLVIAYAERYDMSPAFALEYWFDERGNYYFDSVEHFEAYREDLYAKLPN